MKLWSRSVLTSCCMVCVFGTWGKIPMRVHGSETRTRFAGALPLQLVSILKLETMKEQCLVPGFLFFHQAILRNSWAGGGEVRKLWNPVAVTFSCGTLLGPGSMVGIASSQASERRGRVGCPKLDLLAP